MQNKKYRPIVREPRVLTGWLGHWFIEMQRLAKNRALFSQGYPRTVRVRTENSRKSLISLGAGEANRTPDPNLGKVMLYP